MASVLTSDFQKRLIEAIKEFGGCAYPGELAVRLKVDAGLVALALRQLAAGGLVYRLEESVLPLPQAFADIQVVHSRATEGAGTPGGNWGGC
jgi:hypothetical protein